MAWTPDDVDEWNAWEHQELVYDARGTALLRLRMSGKPTDCLSCGKSVVGEIFVMRGDRPLCADCIPDPEE